jgi:hypothetical protein
MGNITICGANGGPASSGITHGLRLTPGSAFFNHNSKTTTASRGRALEIRCPLRMTPLLGQRRGLGELQTLSHRNRPLRRTARRLHRTQPLGLAGKRPALHGATAGRLGGAEGSQKRNGPRSLVLSDTAKHVRAGPGGMHRTHFSELLSESPRPRHTGTRLVSIGFCA